MLRNMSASEFVGWFDYFRNKGFKRDVDQYMQGQIAAVIHNVNRVSKQSTLFKASDFYPSLAPPKQQTMEEQLVLLRSI